MEYTDGRPGRCRWAPIPKSDASGPKVPCRATSDSAHRELGNYCPGAVAAAPFAPTIGAIAFATINGELGGTMCLGIPGRIVELREDSGLPMGVVDFGGVRREVCLAYVQGDAGIDDYVIVHVGFAIAVVDEAEAHRTFEALRELSQLDELDWLAEVAQSSARGAAS